MDYTVIGDGVNLASRLEGVNKHFGSNILISESTRRLLKGDHVLREIDLLRVKGKTKPVPVFEVLGFHDEASFPRLRDAVGLFSLGVGLYRGHDFAKAERSFKDALDLNPHDTASSMYVARCRAYLAEPPGDDWNGAFTTTEK
jgi:adenylate cyclase